MNMNTRAHIISQMQKECLINYLEQHDFLLESHKKSSDIDRNASTWKELMILLNSKPGPKKTVYQWKETLNELRANARKRAKLIQIQNTGSSAKQTEKDLTPLEHRLLLLTSDKVLNKYIM